MINSGTTLTLVLIITLLISIPLFAQDAELDSLSLIAIYDSTGGPNWYNKAGWENHDRPLNQWDGVTVNATTRRVTQLNFGSNNMSGRLPDDIRNLTELDRLYITENPNLGGNLTPAIGALSKLRYFQVWDTNLSGQIPFEITLLNSLVNLYLAESNFDGPIPPGLDNLVNLDVLSLRGNNLSGPIPPELGNLPNLRLLYLDDNLLTGEIPHEFGNLMNLETLWLQHNQLTGHIPPEFYNMINMNNLVLEGNEFDGEILPEINQMINLRTIRINSNCFTRFPDISPLAPISTLDIQDNQFTFRDIEPNVGNSDSYMYWPQDSVGMRIDTVLHPRQKFTLFTSAGGESTIYQWKRYGVNVGEASADSTYTFSSLTMEDNGRYICEITNTVANKVILYSLPISIEMEYTTRQLDSLALVDLYNSTDGENWNSSTNWLSAENIDTWQGISMTDARVTDIQLSNQNLTGTLPTSIGNLSALENLYLANNSISGGIPKEIGTMSSLQQLWLNSNSLDQAIPNEITNLLNLERIHLTANQIPGQIPKDIGNMTNLWDLTLTQNQLQGELPASITNLSNLESLWLRDNNLSGSLPENIGDLTSLKGLSIGENGFEGAVPISITNLTSLTSLELDVNRLDELPDLSDLSPNLETLKIESNKFTFEDIEPNMSVATTTFSYSPQDSVGIGRDTTVTSGSSLTLDAGVGGVNNLYQWYHDGTALSSETNSTTTIGLVDEITMGSYYCEVYNSVVIALTIYTRPVHVWIIGQPGVTTDPATNISTSSAIMNGRVIPNGLPTSVSFLYSEDQTTWTTISATPGAIEGVEEQTVAAELSSLPSKTTYWFKVSATNSEGTKEGEVLSFKTLSLESPPTVSTAIPTGITPTSAFLSGTINPNDLPTDAFFQFTDSVQVSINQSTPLNGIININVDASATGLSPDTFYQVRLVAINDSGRTNGTWVNFRTLLPGTGPSATTNPADQIAATSARLNGLVNPGGKQTDVVFLWGETTAYGDSVIASSSPISGNIDLGVSATITGLSAGTIYHYKVNVTNEDGQANGDNIEFRTLFPVVELSAPNNAATNISVRPTFQWKVVTNAPGYWLQVATDASFFDIIVSERNILNTSYTALQTLNFETLHFWRVSIDAAGMTPVWSSIRTFTTGVYPTNMTVSTEISFPTKPNNSDYRASDYRIMGLPGNTNVPILELFGEAVDDKWIAYWDNGQSTDYKVKHENSKTFEFQLGRAFWIIYKGIRQIERQVSLPNLNTQNEAEIPLRSGWNLITNPFNFDVEWSEVKAINLTDAPLHRFNGSFSTATTMNPFQGYYYFNQAGTSVLRIPIAPGMAKPVNKDNFDWKIEIQLSSDEQIDHSTRFGIASDASPGIDKYDYRKPRAMGDIPSVNFLRPEWDKDFPVFASDVRATISGLEIWDFQVEVPSERKSVLTFPGIVDIPVDYDVYLIDKTRSTYINLRKEDEYSFNPGKITSHFELLVGEKSMVEGIIGKIIPTEFALGKNFPNPFNPSTTISLIIPERSEITLKVFNILGQEIIILYQGNLEAGRHFFKWNGINVEGQQVPSGVYIYSMSTSQGYHFARKMVLIQ